MADQSPILTKRLRVLRGTHRIIKRSDPESFYAAVAADGDFGDGVNPAVVIAGEIHRLHEKARKIDGGIGTDAKFYGRIYGADKEDDPSDPATWSERRDGMPYQRWADQGFIELSPGDVIDYREIMARIECEMPWHDTTHARGGSHHSCGKEVRTY